MHGRLKVKTTEDQMKAKLVEKEAKIRLFREMKNKIIECRKKSDNSIDILNILAECLLKAPEWNLFWNYRREILTNLDFSEELMTKELLLTERCLKENSKAYAVWHQRCWVLLNMKEPDWSKELELSNYALKLDERNFHCWDHRRYIVENGKLSLSKEFETSEKQILENISNYSSWHYRSSLLLKKSAQLDLSNELDLINNSVFTDPFDQSPWFYLRFLMAYNRKKSFIRELYVTKKLKSIVLITSDPVSEKFMTGVSVLIKNIHNLEDLEKDADKQTENDDKGTFAWKSVLERNVSSVWLMSLENVDLDNKFTVVVTCQSMGPDFKWSCELDPKKQESLIRVDTDINRLLCEIVSEEIPLEVLHEELRIVRELDEMEPDNKWVLMTLLSILRIISPLESCMEIRDRIDSLKKIDPMRKNMYCDMWSKYRIECELISLYQRHQRAVVLRNTGLTSLSQLSWMSLMTDIDLSENQLQSIPEQFQYLVCLIRLNLSRNRIVTLINLRGLLSLQHLDVSDNRIGSYEDLEAVFHCNDLASVNIRGNAVSQLENLTELIASHPSSKLHLQSISIIYDKKTV